MSDHISEYLNQLGGATAQPPAAAGEESIEITPLGGEAPDTDADLDAVLDRIDPAGEEDDDDLEPQSVEDADDDDDEDNGEAAEVEQADAPADEEESAIDTDELAKALQALKRDGVQQSTLEALPNETLLALGAKARERQSKMDDLIRRNAELSKDSGEDTPEDSEAAEPADAPSGDLNKLVAPLADELGEEAAGSVIPLVRAVVQEATREALEQVKQLQDAVPQMRGAILQVVTERARTQLAGDYPQLDSSDTWEAVQGRMATLAKTGEYEDPVLLMRDACRLEIGPTTEPKRAKKKRSQPTAPKGNRKAPMTRDEKDSLILTYLDQGMSPKDAAARAAQE